MKTQKSHNFFSKYTPTYPYMLLVVVLPFGDLDLFFHITNSLGSQPDQPILRHTKNLPTWPITQYIWSTYFSLIYLRIWTTIYGMVGVNVYQIRLKRGKSVMSDTFII